MKEQAQQFVAELVNKIGKGAVEEVVERNRHDVLDLSKLVGLQGRKNVSKNILDAVKQTSMDTRHDLKLAFPPSHFSEKDNPLMQFYQACYESVAVYTEQICANEGMKQALIEAMAKAGINEGNIDEFLNREWEIWARLMDLPQIARVMKDMPDYADFNMNKPENYSLLNAQRKIEHMTDGKLVQRAPLYEATQIVENEVERWNTSLVVQDCLSVLSEKERSLFIDYADGRSLTELAKQYGYANASGVKKMVERIKKKILENFSKNRSAHLQNP